MANSLQARYGLTNLKHWLNCYTQHSPMVLAQKVADGAYVECPPCDPDAVRWCAVGRLAHQMGWDCSTLGEITQRSEEEIGIWSSSYIRRLHGAFDQHNIDRCLEIIDAFIALVGQGRQTARTPRV